MGFGTYGSIEATHIEFWSKKACKGGIGIPRLICEDNIKKALEK